MKPKVHQTKLSKTPKFINKPSMAGKSRNGLGPSGSMPTHTHKESIYLYQVIHGELGLIVLGQGVGLRWNTLSASNLQLFHYLQSSGWTTGWTAPFVLCLKLTFHQWVRKSFFEFYKGVWFLIFRTKLGKLKEWHLKLMNTRTVSWRFRGLNKQLNTCQKQIQSLMYQQENTLHQVSVGRFYIL